MEINFFPKGHSKFPLHRQSEKSQHVLATLMLILVLAKTKEKTNFDDSSTTIAR